MLSTAVTLQEKPQSDLSRARLPGRQESLTISPIKSFIQKKFVGMKTASIKSCDFVKGGKVLALLQILYFLSRDPQ